MTSCAASDNFISFRCADEQSPSSRLLYYYYYYYNLRFLFNRSAFPVSPGQTGPKVNLQELVLQNLTNRVKAVKEQ